MTGVLNRLRFEKPQQKNRWDSPLFHVNMTPISESESALTAGDEISDNKIKKETSPTSGAEVKVLSGENPTKTVFKRTVFKSKRAAGGASESTGHLSTNIPDSSSASSSQLSIDRISEAATCLSISGSFSARSEKGEGFAPEVRRGCMKTQSRVVVLSFQLLTIFFISYPTLQLYLFLYNFKILMHILTICLFSK